MAYRTPGEREDVIDRYPSKPWWVQHPAWYWVTLAIAMIVSCASPIINLVTRPPATCADKVTFVKAPSWASLVVPCDDGRADMTVDASRDDGVVLVRCTCRRDGATP